MYPYTHFSFSSPQVPKWVVSVLFILGNKNVTGHSHHVHPHFFGMLLTKAPLARQYRFRPPHQPHAFLVIKLHDEVLWLCDCAHALVSWVVVSISRHHSVSTLPVTFTSLTLLPRTCLNHLNSVYNMLSMTDKSVKYHTLLMGTYKDSLILHTNLINLKATTSSILLITRHCSGSSRMWRGCSSLGCLHAL